MYVFCMCCMTQLWYLSTPSRCSRYVYIHMNMQNAWKFFSPACQHHWETVASRVWKLWQSFKARCSYHPSGTTDSYFGPLLSCVFVCVHARATERHRLIKQFRAMPPPENDKKKSPAKSVTACAGVGQGVPARLTILSPFIRIPPAGPAWERGVLWFVWCKLALELFPRSYTQTYTEHTGRTHKQAQTQTRQTDATCTHSNTHTYYFHILLRFNYLPSFINTHHAGQHCKLGADGSARHSTAIAPYLEAPVLALQESQREYIKCLLLLVRHAQ